MRKKVIFYNKQKVTQCTCRIYNLPILPKSRHDTYKANIGGVISFMLPLSLDRISLCSGLFEDKTVFDWPIRDESERSHAPCPLQCGVWSLRKNFHGNLNRIWKDLACNQDLFKTFYILNVIARGLKPFSSVECTTLEDSEMSLNTTL